MAALTAEQYTSIVCTGTAVQCNSTSRIIKIAEYDSVMVNSNRTHINITKHGSAIRKSHDIVAIKHDTGIAENNGVVTNNREVMQLR